MTKKENRAAAKAFLMERERQRIEEACALAVKADLAQLDILRRYLIRGAKAPVSTQDLIDAIDDHVEKLTGDRTTLHGQGHSIG